MIIRPESQHDHGPINRVVSTAFRDSPHGDHGEAEIVAALRRDGALALSLVAEGPEGLLAHIAFSAVTISPDCGLWWGLGPLAVVPTAQRRGIGGHLIRAGLAEARKRGVQGCVVLGSPAYYSRFGFAAAPGLGLAGYDGPAFMALRLAAPALPMGEVRYHPAFDAP